MIQHLLLPQLLMKTEKNQNLTGKKISKKSLKQRFDNSIFGLSLLQNFLLITLMISIAAISAFFSACFIYVTILNIIVPSYKDSMYLSTSQLELKSWIIYGIPLISIILWMCVTFLKNIIQSFKITGLLILLFLSLCMIFRLLDITDILVALFIYLFCNIFLGISIFFVSLSLTLSNVLIHKIKYSIIFYYFIFYPIFSYVSGYTVFMLQLLDNQKTINLKKEGILPDYIFKYIILGEVLFGLIILIFSYLLTRYKNDFKFFHNWAIAIGTWGGTSFYNLDLSNVNFRGSKLPNTDLRAKKLYRTCFQDVSGLERARVDNRYLDLDIPKVQQLLTKGYSDDHNFSYLNLRGAFLQNADLRGFNLTDTDLTGADLTGADLRGAILIRTKVIDVDFTRANLTGSCIQDWSYNYQTNFTEIQCQFYFRALDEKGEKIEKFPNNRDFELREFESIYQELENVIELIFKEGENWQTTLFSLKKLQFEDENLGLELKGVEKRGDHWIVKVTYNQNYPKLEVEHLLHATVEDIKLQLAAKAEQVKLLQQSFDQLLEISHNQSETTKKQAQALENLSQKAFGNSFFITGSKITNLAGSGNIDYKEASEQIRSLITNQYTPKQSADIAQKILDQLQIEGIVAPTVKQQIELIQQVILTEANKETSFKELLLKSKENLINLMPEETMKKAMENAIKTLSE
jgi:uncharacterized protein YjbI with pentapeptide repeats